MTIFHTLDILGTLAFAISGSLSATDRKFDLFGATFIGFATAIGGGTVRDCMLGTTPVAWLSNIESFYTIFAGIAIAYFFKTRIMRFNRLLFIFDTVGISVFTIIGIDKGLGANVYAPIAVIMGVTTAVVGGVLRDVPCNDVPLIFHKEIYATACIGGGIVYVLLLHTGVDKDINMILTSVAICLIRTLSVRFNWSLPRF